MSVPIIPFLCACARVLMQPYKRMNITLNGQIKEVSSTQSLKKIVGLFCPNVPLVIAEVNGMIIKNPKWDKVTIQEGDTIELVGFVGGG